MQTIMGAANEQRWELNGHAAVSRDSLLQFSSTPHNNTAQKTSILDLAAAESFFQQHDQKEEHLRRIYSLLFPHAGPSQLSDEERWKLVLEDAGSLSMHPPRHLRC